MSCELRVVSCELRVVSCELRVSSCELRANNCELLKQKAKNKIKDGEGLFNLSLLPLATNYSIILPI